MHRMQSGGWPYSEDGRDSSKAPSLRVAFLLQLSFVRCVAIETVDYRSRVIGTCINVACARAHTEVGGGTGSIAANNKAQGKQCKTKQCVLKKIVCVCVS